MAVIFIKVTVRGYYLKYLLSGIFIKQRLRKNPSLCHQKTKHNLLNVRRYYFNNLQN